MADKELTIQAIDAAYEARQLIGEMPAYKRAEILENVALLLKERADEAAEIISLESAKPTYVCKIGSRKND